MGETRVSERFRSEFTLDRQASLLAVLFLAVQIPAVWLAQQLTAATTQPDTPGGVTAADSTAAESAGAGIAWAGIEVAFAVGLLALIVVYRRLPEWLQETIKINVVLLIFLHLGGQWATAGVLPTGAALVVSILTVYKAVSHYDVYWALNNLLAVSLAIATGAYIALIFGVWGLVVALVALTVYDHVFANKQGWMFTLADSLLRARLPVVVLKPHGWRLDWNAFVDGLGDDEDDPDTSWAIGTADLALPAAFAAAVATAPPGPLASGTLAAAGVVGGVTLACFRLRYEMLTKGSGAGLPALTAGALGGWAVMQVLIGAGRVGGLV